MDVGTKVSDFSAPDQDNQQRSLSSLLENGPVVLFFYPKAMTSGCTAESCHFRDLGAEFEALGAQRVGISADPPEKQAKFDAKNSLGYPLLSDPDRAIAKELGAKRPGPLWNKRSTFVIDTDRTLLAEISSETNMDLHADEALEVLRNR
ncbi:MAG: peroxiredoxin [Microthrixaceae bacterium]|nr:peroxiredoxin [Microthrixaceae bacterium]